MSPPSTRTPARPSGAGDPPDPVPTRVQGLVDRVTFRTEDGSYCVVRVRPERGFGDPEALFSPLGERLTAAGPAPELVAGQRVLLHGHWSVHPRHGRQFRFDRVESLPPLDAEGLIRYLSSSAFPGIGKTLAERIVERLGSQALQKIREEPECLGSIPGLRRDVRERLVQKLREDVQAQEFLAFLHGIGLGPQQAERVQKKFGHLAEARLRANPYLLARGVQGIGFHIADRVAQKLGLEADAPERRRAALLHTLRQAGEDGHVLVPLDRLLELATRWYGAELNPEEVEQDLDALEREREIQTEHFEDGDPENPAPAAPSDARLQGRAVYLPHFHHSEVELAANLTALLLSGPAPALASESALRTAEQAGGLELHPEQRAAVLGLLSQRVALLTGGPGVGKTTIIRLVVRLAEQEGARVLLASPTGRAAKRLAEATGHAASTVHRLLGYEPGEGRFLHNTERALPADLVVVDEVSMLDLVLAHHLLKAVQAPTRLVFVGDPDQLPSVAAGNVLADLLASERIPTWRLRHIYRQAGESLIVANAHRILAGEDPQLPESATPPADFFFFPAENDEAAAERLVEVVTERIPRRFELDWISDVQVLAPMYRGACGVHSLNERLRAAQGIGGREVRWRDRVWRVGDRVIHTRNDYEKEVFNGDMGRIVRIAENGADLTVRYPERHVAYKREEFTDLQPAFAITVHRSQGGEYPAIVMPLVPQHHLMLQRHLLYTAVTRARRLVVLVGSRRALSRAIQNADQSERWSALAQRLQDTSAAH